MSRESGSKGFFLFRPTFLLFIIYVIAYMFLRSNQEIQKQSVAVPSGRGVEIYHMIGADPNLPHWRQQAWRALFSLAMVVEEEGEKWYAYGKRRYHEARGTVQEGTQYAGEKVKQITELIPGMQNQSNQPGQPGQPARMPQPQQYPQPQPYPQQPYPQPQYPQQPPYPQQQYPYPNQQQYPQQQQEREGAYPTHNPGQRQAW